MDSIRILIDTVKGLLALSLVIGGLWLFGQVAYAGWCKF